MATVTVDQLSRNVELLANQIGHWSPQRWRDRGEPVHRLVQQLADLAAEAAGRPKHQVPRLPDPALADQLRVVLAELVEIGPNGLGSPDLSRAAQEIALLRRTLT